jgi:hypothetical protein
MRGISIGQDITGYTLRSVVVTRISRQRIYCYCYVELSTKLLPTGDDPVQYGSFLLYGSLCIFTPQARGSLNPKLLRGTLHVPDM